MMHFRKAHKKDLPAIMAIFDSAKASLKKQNINQWQDTGPTVEILENDINQQICYVIEKQSQILGVCVLLDTPEPTYTIIDGQWHNDQAYSTIHRFALHPSVYGQGIGDLLMRKCQEISIHPVLRIDTHHDNVLMRKLIVRNHFKECGIIVLDNGAKRIAYEKKIR